MIGFRNVSKFFGGQAVLERASFQINPGERVGIVGPNGAGKSTVFNLIAGEIAPDGGEIVVPERLRLGYVRQQLNPRACEEDLLPYVENALPELREIQAEIHRLEGEAAADGNPAARLRRLGELQTRFEHLGGYTLKNRAERMLSGLGFPADWFYRPFRALSGGWQSRAELCRALLAEPDILLLDEPSNYLDIPAVEWLEKCLEQFKGTLALISHDRFLLNSLCTVTIEIANGRAERYAGNYDQYARERAQRYAQRLAARKNQDRKREQLERFIERFRSKATLATQAQSRIKQLARLERIELPKIAESPGRIRLRPPPHCGQEVVRLENAGVTYDGERWVLRHLDLSVNRGEKLALIGYNGMGKTTLLRLLAGNLPPSEGKRVLGHKVRIGYQSQDFAETIDPNCTVFHTLKSVAADVSDQELRTVLGGFGFSGDAVEKPAAVLSGGEKIRLAFARLLVKPPNFLVLDEPTTHLDIEARERLEEVLRDYEGTICLVSHDIDFVRHVATGIIAMTPPGVTRYAGGYEYYREKVSGEEGGASSGKRAAGGAQAQRESERARDLSAAAALAEPSSDKLDKKALRRQRAAERQALHEKTKDLKKAIQKAEKEVERLEAEKADLTRQLSGPPDKTNFASLSRRLQQVQYEIDIATAAWEEATVALERVAGEP